MENSSYMNSAVAVRALLLTEEEALEGSTTISLETQADLAEEDILSFISDNFDLFLKTLRYLKKEDQELLLSYYLLSKPLDVDTPILTTKGWKRNGDLKDGDFVFGDNGKPVEILKAHPPLYPKATYEITLDSGEKLYAGDEHRWVTSTYNERQRTSHREDWVKGDTSITSVRTTQELFETQRHRPSSKEDKTVANHHINLPPALEMPDLNLPIDPYCLGVWLGDGNSDCGIITSSPKDAHEILSHFSKAGYEWHDNKKDKDRWHVLNLYPALKKLGLIKNKHIPALYFKASAEQRLSLLQGLMDSDGCASKSGVTSFSNCSEAIVAGISELLWSLGIKHKFTPHRASCMYKGERRYSDSWKTSFTTTLPCFRLGRKLKLQKRTSLSGGSLAHHIVKVVKLPPRLMRCITVDSASHLYLCGKSLVATHNTQNTLALIHKSTQTVCSFRIRMAIKTLGTFLLVGGEPTEELLHDILTKAGYEDSLDKAPLSRIIMEYVRTRNFQQVASHFGLHRPDVRRAMSRASKALMDSKDGREAAVAAWIHSLIDKVSPVGSGFSKRKSQKMGHIYLRSSPITGQFSMSISDPDFEQMFVSRANR